MGPSTIPSNAAPNRKFVILRTERGPLRSGPSLNFDDAVLIQSPSYKRALVLEQLTAMHPSSANMSSLDDRLDGLGGDTAASEVPPVPEIPASIKPKWSSSSRLSFMGKSTEERQSHSRSKSVSPGRGGAESSSRPPTSNPEKKLQKRSSRSSLARPLSAAFSLSRPTTKDGLKTPGDSSPVGEFAIADDSGVLGSFRSYCFRFSLELLDRRAGPPVAILLQHPRLPAHAQLLIANKLRRQSVVRARAHQRSMSRSSSTSGFADGLLGEIYAEFSGPAAAKPSTAALAALAAEGLLLHQPESPTMVSPETTAAYCGKALSEWTLVVGECNMFFERRRHENVPTRWVETPLLGTEGLVRGPRG
jgi:hypothetical protein